MKKTLVTLTLGLFVIGFSSMAFGQLSIENTDTDYTIDFDNTVSDVNNGQYAGAGFVSDPDEGQLDSDAWATTGMDDGDTDFGGSYTSGDHARGQSDGGVTTGGFYAFQVETGNYAFGIQPGGSDWTPGTVVLKIQNNTGTTLTALDIAYKIWVYNDKDRANSFNFSHSSDGSTWTPESLDYTSPGAASGSAAWESTNKSTTLSVSISNGNYYYLRWEGDDVSGDGSRDEFALDDIVIRGSGVSGGVSDPSNFTATPVSTSQINLSWTKNSNNDDVMVAWNSTDNFGTPSNGTSYSPGEEITGGGTVLYNGSETSYSHTSLSSNTQYFYKAWSVDGSIQYSSGVTADATTYKEEPTNHVTDFTATASGWNKIDLSWAENDGSVVPDGYLIKASTSDNVSDPVDGTPVDDNTTIGNDSGAINLAHGTTSYQWTELDAETTYYFKIYPYTNSGSAIDYKTDGTVPSANATTGEKPAVPYVFFSEYIEGSSNNKAIEIYNGSLSTIDLSDYAVKLASNGGGWGTTENLLGNLASGDVYVIYNSSACSDIIDVGDLVSSVTYFNGDDALGLFYSDFLIDVIGEPDNDPGTAWDVAGTSNATVEHTLVRKYAVTTGNTDWSASAGTTTENSEWIVYPQDTFSYLGSHDGQTLPVELSTFTATYQVAEQSVSLFWRTESETDNIGWYVYRNTANDFEHANRLNSDLILGYGTTSEPHTYTFEDPIENASPGDEYWYWIESRDLTGKPHRYGPLSVVISPSPPDEPDTPSEPIRYGLYQNKPNPLVQGEVKIGFCLPQTANVKLNVYNIRGELVKQVYSGTVTKDEVLERSWDGRDSYGNLQPTGIYLYQLLVNDKVYETKKMIIMR